MRTSLTSRHKFQKVCISWLLSIVLIIDAQNVAILNCCGYLDLNLWRSGESHGQWSSANGIPQPNFQCSYVGWDWMSTPWHTPRYLLKTLSQELRGFLFLWLCLMRDVCFCRKFVWWRTSGGCLVWNASSSRRIRSDWKSGSCFDETSRKPISRCVWDSKTCYRVRTSDPHSLEYLAKLYVESIQSSITLQTHCNSRLCEERDALMPRKA